MIEFRILSTIREMETIAAGHGVYIRRYLERTYGKGRWRKKKGVATVELAEARLAKQRSTGTKLTV